MKPRRVCYITCWFKITRTQDNGKKKQFSPKLQQQQSESSERSPKTSQNCKTMRSALKYAFLLSLCEIQIKRYKKKN